MYDCYPTQVGNDKIVIGNGTELYIQSLGKVNIVFHSTTDILLNFISVALVRNLSFNLYSLDVEDQPVVRDRSSPYALSGCLFFLRGSYGSYLHSTRVLPPHSLTNPFPPVHRTGTLAPALLATDALAPGKIITSKEIHTNNMHSSYAHEDARYIVDGGGLLRCHLCSMSKGVEVKCRRQHPVGLVVLSGKCL